MRKKKLILVGMILIGLVLIIFVYSGKKENKLTALVMYESEVGGYTSLIKKLKKDKNVDLSIQYLIGESDFSNNIDVWKKSREGLKEKISKSGVDILLGFPYEYLSESIEYDQLLNLDNVIDKEIYQHTYKPIIDISKKFGNGHLYFLSPTFTTKFLVINETLLSNLGIKNTKNIMTWDEFENLAVQINNKSNKDDIVPISLGPSGKEGFFMDFELITKTLELPIKSNNGDIYGDAKWNDVFYKFLNMYKNYGIKNEKLEYDLANNGKIALRVIYPVELYNLKNVNYKYSVYPVPVFEGKKDTANIIPQNIAISKLSKKKDLSIDVLNYLNGKKYAAYMISNGLFPEGEFVSYYDEDILKIYKKKFDFLNPEYIYFGDKGYTKTEEFTLNEYSKFHEISREVFLDILDDKISILNGLNKIKNNCK